MSTRSRNEAMWAITRGGKRTSQSPHTIACTCLSVSSPKTRLMSLWSSVSSSNSSQVTFFCDGGSPRWSLRIAIRHVRQITSFSFNTSWWKSLLGDGAWPTFSMKTFAVLIVCKSKACFGWNASWQISNFTLELRNNSQVQKAAKTRSVSLLRMCVCAGNLDQLGAFVPDLKRK